MQKEKPRRHYYYYYYYYVWKKERAMLNHNPERLPEA